MQRMMTLRTRALQRWANTRIMLYNVLPRYDVTITLLSRHYHVIITILSRYYHDIIAELCAYCPRDSTNAAYDSTNMLRTRVLQRWAGARLARA